MPNVREYLKERAIMERKVFEQVESFSKEKPIHVPIFASIVRAFVTVRTWG